MDLNAIRIQAIPGEYESLVLALRAVSWAGGGNAGYDELSGALGVSFAAVAAAGEPSPAVWPTYGRDRFIEPVARAFGMHLRDLHPPDVGVDMLSADEFPQHFELSYKPLIRRAVEHGQPVLAWRGWDGAAARLWGVITGLDGEEFMGVAPPAGSRKRRLVHPALQCYVVERYEPRDPSPAEMLAMGVRHADAFLNPNGQLHETTGRDLPGVVTGPAALACWRQAVETQSGDEIMVESTLRAHLKYAAYLAAGHRSAERFLRQTSTAAKAEYQDAIDDARTLCDFVAAHLSATFQKSRIHVCLSKPEGWRLVLSAIEAAELGDTQLAEQVRLLRQSL